MSTPEVVGFPDCEHASIEEFVAALKAYIRNPVQAFVRIPGSAVPS